MGENKRLFKWFWMKLYPRWVIQDHWSSGFHSLSDLEINRPGIKSRILGIITVLVSVLSMRCILCVISALLLCIVCVLLSVLLAHLYVICYTNYTHTLTYVLSAICLSALFLAFFHMGMIKILYMRWNNVMYFMFVFFTFKYYNIQTIK